MKIVILTHSADRHYYFCNQVIENSNAVGVITGSKVVHKRFVEKMGEKFCKKEVKYTIRNQLLNVIFKKYGELLREEKEQAEKIFFGGSREVFQEKHSHLLLAHVDTSHRSINDPYYIDLIRQKCPDIIVVMGTCLVGKEIISSAPYVLNMHTGLSPYYRGGYTNLWPIIEEDFGLFGVTIHRMSLGIDSGDIIFTKRPKVYPDDTFGKINSRCIVIGTRLMIKAIQHIEGGRVSAAKQWTKGKLFNDRDMNNYIAYRYFRMKEKFLQNYCALNANNQLAKIRIIGDN